jgi:hypothetical protein
VDLRRATGRLRHCHPHGERHPTAVARWAQPDLSRGDTGRDVAGCAERELVGIGAFDLTSRTALGRPALGPHGPGGATRSVSGRVLQPVWRAICDPEPVAVFGAEQLQLVVIVAVAIGLAVSFPDPDAHPLADGLPDSLPHGDDPAAYHAAAYHAAANDPAAYDPTTHDAAADHAAAYYPAAYYDSADHAAAVFVGAFGDARLGVGALLIVR